MSADSDDCPPPEKPKLLRPLTESGTDPAQVEKALPTVIPWLGRIAEVDTDTDAVPPFDVANALAGHQPPPKPDRPAQAEPSEDPTAE